MQPNNVSVIGLGKLGAPIAIGIASRGFKVTGVDINQKYVNDLNQSKIDLKEPGLSKLLKSNRKRLVATINIDRAINNSDITFIIVPTPTNKDGSFSNTHILKVIKSIGSALTKKNNYHLISIVSTIMPGSMEREILPALKHFTGKKAGLDFGICYNPTFVALGNVVNDFLSPDFILIGESDKKAGDFLDSFYMKFTFNQAPIKRMNFINSEITKIALNTYITTKISYANMLTELCEQLRGADIDQVTRAIGLDTRIGAKYLTGGAPFGGPCFPRDNKALTRAGKLKGLNLQLPQTTEKINQQQLTRIVNLIKTKIPAKGSISVIGLTYRPNTYVVENSAGINLALVLTQLGFKVTVFDPPGEKNARQILQKSVRFAKTLESCFKNKDAIILTNKFKEINSIDPKTFGKPKPFLIDYWRVLTSPKVKSVVEYYPVGKNPNI